MSKDCRPVVDAESSGAGAESDSSSPLVAYFDLQKSHETVSQEEFQNHILEYVVEWEKATSLKIKDGLKQVPQLEKRRKHYKQKVKTLRKNLEKMEEKKGKEHIPKKVSERMERNEMKKQTANSNHKENLDEVCNMMDQVTRNGWNDLAPFLEHLVLWEISNLNRDNGLTGGMAKMLESVRN